MGLITVLVIVIGLSLTSHLSTVNAQPSIMQRHDGTSGTLSPLGEQAAIYSDAHGNKGVTHQGTGIPSQIFSSPHGAVPGTITPFGTPTPPNLITPAPLLPLQPRGMAAPQPQAPASSATPGGSGSFGSRPGR